jgi:tetratricopeptide (TPR) repeat protein
MTDAQLDLIDRLVEAIFQGKLMSKEAIYRRLTRDVKSGEGELFERDLEARISAMQAQLDAATDEFKQAKAGRILKALQSIQGEWEHLQHERQISATIALATQAILTAPPDDRWVTWLNWIDRCQSQHVTLDRLKLLAQSLEQAIGTQPESDSDLRQLIAGIRSGLTAWGQLEEHLMGWIYETPTAIGFEEVRWRRSPWRLWSQKVSSGFPQQLFAAISDRGSIGEWMRGQSAVSASNWVELVVLLEHVQWGLVAWFDRQPYDSKWGTAQSISTFLTFTAIWSELSYGFDRAIELNPEECRRLSRGCFQLLLKILRTFSQQPYFPLYGGVFALFSEQSLKVALDYLDDPFRQVERSQEKARILTLLGYSQRSLGNNDRAIAFHLEALDMARSAEDRPCEIANLNHLGRAYAAQKQYEAAIGESQRALILARQLGDRLGEANASSNLGYAQVLQAQQLEQMEPEVYEGAIGYLERGLQLAQKLGDRQSLSLCYLSLGMAYTLSGQAQTAISYLTKGVETARAVGDLYWQGVSFTYLAEAYYSLKQRSAAVVAAALASYLLDRIQSREWRQPAGLLSILQGQMGAEVFEQCLAQHRAQLIAEIGGDGYDELPQLLKKYQGLS